MDGSATVLWDADVLVVDDRIAAVGPRLDVPEGTQEIDARGGIVMPGMIDTHRHMWQTAMRGYGADWTLTQYFVWYYLEHGRKFRPEDVALANRLAAIESLDAGVTTTVDWSHGLSSLDHGEAAADALFTGRFVLAYGNIQADRGRDRRPGHPVVPVGAARRFYDDRMGVQIAFDVTGDPAFPEKAAFEAARELGIPVTDARRGLGRHQRRRHPAHARARVHDPRDDLRARLHPHPGQLPADRRDGRPISVATESECSAGQGHAPTEQVLQYGIPVSLSVDTSVVERRHVLPPCARRSTPTAWPSTWTPT